MEHCSDFGSSLRSPVSSCIFPSSFMQTMSYSYIYVLFSSILELRCVYSYYHLGPLKRSYFSVGYLLNIVELLPFRVAGRRDEDVGVFPPRLRGDTRYYPRTRCPGVVSTSKVCDLARNVVVAAGMTVLLGLCNPPRRGVDSLPNLG